MKLDVTQDETWVAGIEDRPGGLLEKIDALSSAGVNLEFLIARRSPEKPGAGVVFVTPIEGDEQVKAAKQAGFDKSTSMYGLRVTAADTPGLGAQITREIANAGINLRGVSAAAIGSQAVLHLAFDSAQDAEKAMNRLKQIE